MNSTDELAKERTKWFLIGISVAVIIALIITYLNLSVEDKSILPNKQYEVEELKFNYVSPSSVWVSIYAIDEDDPNFKWSYRASPFESEKKQREGLQLVADLLCQNFDACGKK